jgi:hypothetical protein
MKPAMRGGEAPPEKNAPGCCGDDDDGGGVGKGMKVVVVVVGAARVTEASPFANIWLERRKEDMAGGQGNGRK